MLKPNALCDGIRWWSLPRVCKCLFYEGSRHEWEFSALRKRPHRAPRPFHHVKAQWEAVFISHIRSAGSRSAQLSQLWEINVYKPRVSQVFCHSSLNRLGHWAVGSLTQRTCSQEGDAAKQNWASASKKEVGRVGLEIVSSIYWELTMYPAPFSALYMNSLSTRHS